MLNRVLPGKTGFSLSLTVSISFLTTSTKGIFCKLEKRGRDFVSIIINQKFALKGGQC